MGELTSRENMQGRKYFIHRCWV